MNLHFDKISDSLLGSCKTDLSRPVILYYRSFQGDTSVVVLIVLCLGV